MCNTVICGLTCIGSVLMVLHSLTCVLHAMRLMNTNNMQSDNDKSFIRAAVVLMRILSTINSIHRHNNIEHTNRTSDDVSMVRTTVVRSLRLSVAFDTAVDCVCYGCWCTFVCSLWCCMNGVNIYCIICSYRCCCWLSVSGDIWYLLIVQYHYSYLYGVCYHCMMITCDAMQI